MRLSIYMVLAACFTLAPLLAMATDNPAASQTELDNQVKDLKKSALELNRDLLLLQDELLPPATSQLSVFLSLDNVQSFTPASLKLRIDGKDVSDYQYTQRDIDALGHGGVQRLYSINLRPGEHDLAVIIAGKGPRGREIELKTSARITKDPQPKYVELKIVDRAGAIQPEFKIREW